MTRERFTELVLDSEQTLYRVSMSMLRNESDCEDAVQSAILKAYEKLSTLKKEEFFKTWLVRILINICKKQLKTRNRSTELEEYHETEMQAPASTEQVEVRLAIQALPEIIREVVVLHYIEDFSVKEIKDVLRVPEGTVKSRLFRGRELLKISLE